MMIRIAIVGCGRILNAHLQGFKALREAGIDNFRITALVSRPIPRMEAHMEIMPKYRLHRKHAGNLQGDISVSKNSQSQLVIHRVLVQRTGIVKIVSDVIS